MIEELNKQITELEQFRDDIDRSQVTFPLDKTSLSVLAKDILVPNGFIVTPYSLATYDEACEVIIFDKKYVVNTTSI